MGQSPLFVSNVGWTIRGDMDCLRTKGSRVRPRPRHRLADLNVLKAGHPQGASLHKIRPMQPSFSCYVGTGFTPVHTQADYLVLCSCRDRVYPCPLLILREEYHKTGAPVVTYFLYFPYFPNEGRFFCYFRVVPPQADYMVLCSCRDRACPCPQ